VYLENSVGGFARRGDRRGNRAIREDVAFDLIPLLRGEAEEIGVWARNFTLSERRKTLSCDASGLGRKREGLW
jgi:hypothetical protein